jgi:hypothetical protein
MISNNIGTDKSHEILKSGTMPGVNPAILDALLETDPGQLDSPIWEAPSIQQIGRHELVFGWRYIGGRWVWR